MKKMGDFFPARLKAKSRNPVGVEKDPIPGKKITIPQAPPKVTLGGKEVAVGKPAREVVGREKIFEHQGPFLVHIPDLAEDAGVKVITPSFAEVGPYVQFARSGKKGLVNIFIHGLRNPKAMLGEKIFARLELWKKTLRAPEGAEQTFLYVDFYYLEHALGRKAPFSWRVSPSDYVGGEMSGMSSFRRFQCPPPVIAMIVVGESSNG